MVGRDTRFDELVKDSRRGFRHRNVLRMENRSVVLKYSWWSVLELLTRHVLLKTMAIGQARTGPGTNTKPDVKGEALGQSI